MIGYLEIVFSHLQPKSSLPSNFFVFIEYGDQNERIVKVNFEKNRFALFYS